MLSRPYVLSICALALLAGNPDRPEPLLVGAGTSVVDEKRTVETRAVGSADAAKTVGVSRDDATRGALSADKTEDLPHAEDQTPLSSNLVGLVLASLGGVFGLGSMFVSLRAAARWGWTGWLYSFLWLFVPMGVGMAAFLFGTAIALEFFGEAFTVAFLFFSLPLTVLGYPVYGLLLVYNPTFQTAREEANERRLSRSVSALGFTIPADLWNVFHEIDEHAVNGTSPKPRRKPRFSFRLSFGGGGSGGSGSGGSGSGGGDRFRGSGGSFGGGGASGWW
jgi:uncharacterized membrane protein YgcG